MPYGRKKTYRTTKKKIYRKGGKINKFTAIAVKKIVKSQMNKVIETKRNDYLFEPIPLSCFYHNTWYMFESDCFFLNQGVQDSQSSSVPQNRIGDSIYAKNIRYRILFTSFVDRPNILLRIVIMKVKQFAGSGLVPTASTQLSNVIVQPIDAENTNNLKCMYDKTFTLNRNVNTQGATRDYKFLWDYNLKLNQRMKYPDGSTQPSNHTYRIYACMYDTQASLATDNLGRFSYRRTLYFQDA